MFPKSYVLCGLKGLSIHYGKEKIKRGELIFIKIIYIKVYI